MKKYVYEEGVHRFRRNGERKQKVKGLSREKVQGFIYDLGQWAGHIDRLEMTTRKLSDEQPEVLVIARELQDDFADHEIPAPELGKWIADPDRDIPTNALMGEMATIAMTLPKRNGLSFDEALSRKSPELREAIVAVRDAIPKVQDRYARDEELPILFDTLLDPQLKTINGSTIGETLRKAESVLARTGGDHPSVKSAVRTLGRVLGYRV